MSYLWLAAVAIGVTPTGDAALKDGPKGERDALPVLSAKEIRETFREALRASYGEKADPKRAVRMLAKVYRHLDRDKKMRNKEREQLIARVRSRVVAMSERIVDEALREKAKRKREQAKAEKKAADQGSGEGDEEAEPSGSPADYARPGAIDDAPRGQAGGGAQDEGEELVELIRSVIAPDTWEVNGGEGRIRYYQPLKVLVVYNSGEVHGLVGRLRDALGN